MTTPHGDAADATLLASRALLGVIARSATEALAQVTLPELRILVLLTSNGPLAPGDITTHLHGTPAITADSLESLTRQGLVEDAGQSSNRVQITSRGREIVDEVTARRRTELSAILAKLTPGQQLELQNALRVFAEAAEETPAEELLILGL